MYKRSKRYKLSKENFVRQITEYRSECQNIEKRRWNIAKNKGGSHQLREKY